MSEASGYCCFYLLNSLETSHNHLDSKCDYGYCYFGTLKDVKAIQSLHMFVIFCAIRSALVTGESIVFGHIL